MIPQKGGKQFPGPPVMPDDLKIQVDSRQDVAYLRGEAAKFLSAANISTDTPDAIKVHQLICSPVSSWTRSFR